MSFESTLYPKKVGFFARNKAVFLSVGVFAAAMIIGSRAVALGTDDFASKQLEMRCNQPFAYLLLNLFISRIIDFAVVFLSGFFIFGAPVSTIWLGFSGLRCGLTAGGLYTRGFAGFGCWAVVFMPFAVAQLLLLAVLNAKSCTFSVKLLRCATSNGRIDKTDGLRLYLLRSTVLLLGTLFLVLIESADGCLLTGIFGLR